MENKEICLVGGAGFLGRHFAESFKESNVTIIDILEQSDVNIPNNKKLNYYNYQKTGFDIIRNKDFEIIFFLAGNASVQKSIINPIYDLKTNTLILLELLELVKNKKTKIVYTSSAACHGEMEKGASSYGPVSPYGISKLASENYLNFYNKFYSVPTLVCRIFSVYGEFNKKQMIFETIQRLKDNKKKLKVFIYLEIYR